MSAFDPLGGSQDGLAGSYSDSYFTVWGPARRLPHCLHHVLFPPALREGSDYSTPLPAPVIICLFDYSRPTEWV
jgi:hypothetical protein